jgi:DNA-binding transcriptional LysR family regulator
MLRKIDWESQIGRRMRLRDLHVFSTVVRLGSMAKAARQLGVSQPAISEVIADLEHALGVRLLDRNSQGVEATAYGAALERRSLAAFDELRQSIRDIEFLADPGVGELRIGCPESISAAILQPIVEQFTEEYPRVVLDVDTVNTLSFAQKLRDRQLDVVLARGGWPIDEPQLMTDLNVETLFDDELVIAVGSQSPWARRRKVDIAELREERWILTSGDLWNYRVIAKAFQMRGVEMPNISIKTISVYLRANMTATGRFITTFPRSVLHLHADRFALKRLAVDLPDRAWPIKIATLKNRTLSPVVERFIACAHAVARSMAESMPSPDKARSERKPART